MSEKHQVMYPPKAPNGTLDRKREMTAWPFSRLWRVSDPILFQVILLAALLATVLGDCGPPPNLHFASLINEVNGTNFKIGTTLRYSCRPGYSRTSSKPQHVTCRAGGTWHYIVSCVKKQCSNPGELHNGHVIPKTDFSFGSHIEFSCEEGYILIGSTTSYCEIQDRAVAWSDPFPECIIAQCKNPPDISNGKHSGRNEGIYTYGSSVTYNCEPGFSMLGKPSISCTVENKTIGVWSPSPPTCKKINCPQPHVKNGNIVIGVGPTYTYKDSISFDCKRGFILKGSSVIRCEADNNWNPLPPTCELNGCNGLPEIPHVSWEVRGYDRPAKDQVYDVDTVLKYRCLPGYKAARDRPTAVTCQRDFRWTPHAECEEVCCPAPDLKNDKILQQRKRSLVRNCPYFYGDWISYSCYEGHTSEATCLGDGTWGSEPPTCDQSCNNPPIIAHGHYQKVTSYQYGTTKFTYKCDKGYTLHGEATLSCHSSGWSAEAPQCKALCLEPEIEHGTLSEGKRQYSESENVTIQCDSGYGVVGPQSITCSEDRTWYPQVPKCEWVVPEGCEHVLAGRKIMQCLPRVEDVKMALEVYKLSLEIELLELQRDKERKSALESSLQLFPKEERKEEDTLLPSIQNGSSQFNNSIIPLAPNLH